MTGRKRPYRSSAADQARSFRRTAVSTSGISPGTGPSPPGIKSRSQATQQQQTYPVDVAVTYENQDGDMVTSSTETAGIPGRRENQLRCHLPIRRRSPRDPVELSKSVFKNTGDATAYGAQVRISAVGPFTSSDDTSYLGDLKPGDTATARFQMSVDSAATAGNYTLDTQVRYRDALDNSQVSDTFKVPVTVVSRTVIRRPGRCS